MILGDIMSFMVKQNYTVNDETYNVPAGIATPANAGAFRRCFYL